VKKFTFAGFRGAIAPPGSAPALMNALKAYMKTIFQI